MGMYERIRNVIQAKGMKVTNFELEHGFAKGYLCKINNHAPSQERMQIILDSLDITMDYVTGKKDYIICKECGFLYNPGTKDNIREHDEFHKQWKGVKERFPDWTNYADMQKRRYAAVASFRSTAVPDRDKVEIFKSAVRYDYLLEMAKSNFLSMEAFNDYAMRIVRSLSPDSAVSENLIRAIYATYGIFESIPNTMLLTTQSIPMLGEIACGEPILMDDSHAELYSGIGMSVKADFCLKCKGDSMVNARIHDGDIVFIKKDEPIEDGQIYAVAIDDEATLKRVYRSENTVTLVAENPAYAPIVVTGADAKNVRILGKAVAFQSIVR